MSDIATRPYLITISDIVKLRLRLFYRRLFRWPPSLYTVWMMALPLLLAVMDQAGPAQACLYVAISLILWLAIVPALDAWARYSSILKDWNSASSITTILTPAEVILRSEAPDVCLSWAVFSDLLVMGQALCLLNKTNTGFLIKPEAFADSAERQAFINMARQHISDANHKQISAFDHEPEPRKALPDLQTLPYPITFRLFATSYVAVMYRAARHPLGLLILFAAGAILIAWQVQHMMQGYTFIGPLPLMLAVVCLGTPPLYYLLIRLAWREARLKGLDVERVVAIDPEGVHTRSRRFDIRLSWLSIRAITRFWGCTIFWTSTQIGITMGSEAFADTAEAAAFHNQAAKWWRAARAKPAADSPPAAQT